MQSDGMLLCDINNREEVERFKKIFTKQLDENEFYWILLETKVIPEGSEGLRTRRAFALCHAVQKDYWSPKIKIVNGDVVDFGESFESAQNAIYQLVDYCLVTHSQPMKIGPRDSIYREENHFSLEVHTYWYHETAGFYNTNIGFIEGKIKCVDDVRKNIEKYYSSFKDIASYDRCANNALTVAQRELEAEQK